MDEISVIKKRLISILLILIFPGIQIFIGGCITSQPSKFYILTPTKYNIDKIENNVADTQTISLQNKNFTIGVGPVTIAKYLDRSQLVVRLTPNQIRLEDFHQWAGSPRDDIPSILTENISSLVGIDTIYKYPWQSYAEIDYQIAVEIIQLDGRPDDSVRLVARWEIIRGSSKSNVRGSIVKSGKTDLTEPVSDSALEALSVNRFDSFAASQSRALGRLSKIIAISLMELL